MRSSRKLLSFLLLFTLCSFLMVNSALSFTVLNDNNGHNLHWMYFKIPVKYAINYKGTPDTAGEFAAIQNAFKAWETGTGFKTLLLEDQEIKKHLSEADIKEIFSMDYHLKYVDELFGRVFA